MKLLIRWAISAFSLFVAAWAVAGIRVDDGGGWVVYAVMAVVLGLVNAFVRPLLKLLTCPLILLTLGLFTLVLNALTLLLSAWVANNLFNVGFYIDGFWSAFWGALIVSIVSVVLNVFVKDDDKKDKPHKH
ncbi:MAG: phage holin family protein [Anaerolineae bacterium]